NFVFITAEGVAPGSYGSLEAADRHCEESAAAAGLPPGPYVAWLSTQRDSAKARLGNARGWVRPDGYPVVDQVDDLVKGRMYMPIRVSARGAAVNDFVATGTQPTGLLD